MDDDIMINSPFRDWESRVSVPDREPIPFLFWDDVRPNLDAADFVEGLLLDAAMSVVYGQSNSDKQSLGKRGQSGSGKVRRSRKASGGCGSDCGGKTG
jgi:hypothetical protein